MKFKKGTKNKKKYFSKQNIEKYFNNLKKSFTKEGIKKNYNDIKVSSKKYISTNVLFCSYIIISLFLSTFLRTVTVGGLFEFRPFLSDLSIILLVGSFGYFLKPKKQFLYYFICIIFYMVLAIGNSIYYQFFLSYLSISLIAAVSQVQDVNSAVIDKLSIFNFIYLLGPIIFIFINKKLKKGNYFNYVTAIEKSKLLFKKTILSGTGVLLIIVLTMSALEWSRLNKQWNREYIVQRLGIHIYTINDVIQGIQPKISALFNYDESAFLFREFYSNKKETKTNKNTGVFKDKNVIFIHMESIQNFVINLKVNGQEITPFLNSLIKESKYFTSFYPQISIGTSSDTEFTLLTSLMPSNSGTAFNSYADRTFVSLPSLFKEQGYYTFSMHGNKADYWNRRTMHRTLGYDYFYAKDKFTINEWIGLGISDKDFFTQAVDIIKGIDTEYEKYFGTIITLTNHTPWDNNKAFEELVLTKKYTEKNRDGIKETKEAPWLQDSEMGRYLTSTRYADQALEMFITKLKEEGLLDDTVLVLYGDHQAKLPISEFNLLYNYDPINDKIKTKDDDDYIQYSKYENYLNNKTPLIIYSGQTDVEFKGVVTDVMGMYDVLPTITNLFGTMSSRYALGNDVFSNNEKIVIFPNGNFLTNKVYYNSTTDEFVTLKDFAVSSEYIERLKEYTDQRLEVSNALLVHDLIKNESKNLDLGE